MRAWVRESDVIQADRATHVLSLLLVLLHLLVVVCLWDCGDHLLTRSDSSLIVARGGDRLTHELRGIKLDERCLLILLVKRPSFALLRMLDRIDARECLGIFGATLHAPTGWLLLCVRVIGVIARSGVLGDFELLRRAQLLALFPDQSEHLPVRVDQVRVSIILLAQL